uniref:Uncharacterized protein n=1 Tax=Graphocephala atropunctata TaxID=36148 RepID=A0A1B6LBJ2_9HEMI
MSSAVVWLVVLLMSCLGTRSVLQDQGDGGQDYGGMYDYPEQRDEDYQVTEPEDLEVEEETTPSIPTVPAMVIPTRGDKRYDRGHIYMDYDCVALCRGTARPLSFLPLVIGVVAALWRLLGIV